MIRSALAVLPRRRSTLALALLCGFSELAVLTAVPLTTAKIIDSLVWAIWPDFQRNVAVLAGLTVAQGFLGFLNRYLSTRIDERLGDGLRRRTVASILHRDLTFFDRFWSGDLISRSLNDTSAMKTVITGVLLQAIYDLCTLSLVGVILFRMHVALALLTIAAAPLTLLAGRPLRNQLERLSLSLREAVGRLQGTLQGWLARPTALKLFAIEHAAQDHFDEHSRGLAANAIRLGRSTAFLGGINSIFVGLPALAIFGYGGSLVLRQSLTIGELFAFMSFAAYFNAPIQRLLGIFISLIPTLIPIYRRIAEITEGIPLHRGAAVPGISGPLRIRATGVVIPFQGGEGKLSIESAQMTAGEVIGVSGPNGSGKSTLVRALAGVVQFDGELAITSASGEQVAREDWRHVVGVLPQENVVFDGSLSDNITLFDERIDTDRLRLALRAAGLAEWVSTMPHGIDTQVTTGTSGTFSGGQLQRIGIARVLYRDSPVVILDEPVASLDAASRELLRSWLPQLAAKRLVIIVAHTNEMLALCDRLYVTERAPGLEKHYLLRPDGRLRTGSLDSARVVAT